MKTLLYTISNFCPYADKCMELLYQSVSLNNTNFDFVVLSNKEAPESFKYPVIVDDDPIYESYVGFLKYSNRIPENYDQYIYLDSDILYFGKLSQIISTNYNLTITKENFNMSSKDWFEYKFVPQSEKEKLKTTSAINAGSFAFKDLSFLVAVKDLYQNYIQQEPIENAKLEQSSFNYALAKLSNFNLNQYKDISPICELYSGIQPIQNKILYHFCNFSNPMKNKFHNMKELYDTYTTQR